MYKQTNKQTKVHRPPKSQFL